MRTLLAGLGCIWMTACSTPPEAMQQANHTVKLLSQMEVPLSEFRRSWSGLEQSRLSTLQAQRELLAVVNLAAERDSLARSAAGDTRIQLLSTKLLANADSIVAAQAKSETATKAYTDKLAGLLQPLPSTTASVTEAQAAVAKLGVELSLSDRGKELNDFVSDVAKGLKANKKALEEAKSKAMAAATSLTQTIEADKTAADSLKTDK